MKQSNLVTLTFTHAEVMEALRDWCAKNHPTVVDNFSRNAEAEWVEGDLSVMFDGQVEVKRHRHYRSNAASFP